MTGTFYSLGLKSSCTEAKSILLLCVVTVTVIPNNGMYEELVEATPLPVNGVIVHVVL